MLFMMGVGEGCGRTQQRIHVGQQLRYTTTTNNGLGSKKSSDRAVALISDLAGVVYLWIGQLVLISKMDIVDRNL